MIPPYPILYNIAILALLILIGVMMVRVVQGPGTTDRILSINMISTMCICIILILSQFLGEAWLLDVALIYAMISLIVVTMLASMYVKTSGDDSGRTSDKALDRGPDQDGEQKGGTP